MRRWLIAFVSTLAGLGATAIPAAALPGWPSVGISSSYGSGDFGRWVTDAFGLPSYRYTADELSDPVARQPELAGSNDAWTQLANDHILADAFNHGYVELWSQDRRYEWTNRYAAAAEHFAGGYGYLRVDGHVTSTLYDDHPASARTARDFGVGYFHHALSVAGLVVDEYVYPPFGDDPVLLHDVTIRKRHLSSSARDLVRILGREPLRPGHQNADRYRPCAVLPSLRALETTQSPTTLDRRPSTIFAAVLRGPLGGRVGDARAFFGAGSRGQPAAVVAGRLNGALAPGADAGAVGHAMFAFSAPIVVGPHATVSLRYVYGAAHASAVPALARKYQRMPSPLRVSEQKWHAWLPQIAFGPGRAWLSRELQWDAYTVRSGATYEECRGRHIISQGSYYQYAFGFQGAFRDPLQHILPMI